MMSDMEINQVIAQMRALSNEISPQAATETRSPGDPDFGAVMRGAVDSVNEQLATSSKMVDGFLTGESDRSLAEVMVQTQKAGVSFRAMTEVRNRLIEAYREVMNMPI